LGELGAARAFGRARVEAVRGDQGLRQLARGLRLLGHRGDFLERILLEVPSTSRRIDLTRARRLLSVVLVAHPALAATLAQFEARVHRTKNRLVAVPASEQKRLGLTRRPDNHLLFVSIRRKGVGRWNHHYVKLTFDNEFAIPSDVAHIRGGEEIEVKIHRVIEDRPLQLVSEQSGADVLLAWLENPQAGWREDGSSKVDEYLAEDINAANRLR
jgi:hypothetical protein